MPGKVQQEKLAWQWVEQIADPKDVTPEHVEAAYHLNIKPCTSGGCRRNCKGNPFCLNGLGERPWFKELDETSIHDFDPESERREEGQFVGLKNLGATCYVNTFLQLCFHSTTLREAICQWRDPQQPTETGEDWKPSTICGHLQLLFGLLQYSKRAYIDPSSLIECLGLDTGEQQDAQEFSKLFLSVLERALLDDMPEVQSNVIQQLFTGTYCYVTRCQKCGSESSREATFYELDINIRGHSTLQSSLQDFLKEEKLDGDNQYMCNTCDSKQNAVRSIRLATLPPVLNLQLLRFVYDLKKGQKKKLNSYLTFGDVLDMSPFLQQPPMTTVYDLTGVLVHRGPTAYSGHYVAHIQDRDSKLWYRFNDEEITIMKGKKFHLGKEEEIFAGDKDSESNPVPKTPKGSHSSKDAYMLVYARREPEEEGLEKNKENGQEVDIEFSGYPQPVIDYIQRDNAKFEDWIQEIVISQDATVFNQREKQKLVQTMFLNLQGNSADDCEWIPADWLSSWLSDPEKARAISLTEHLCPHGKLHPDSVVKMKLVSTEGANHLYENYGGETHLLGREGLCTECVCQRCREVQFKEKLAEHNRFFTTALKQAVDSEKSYWVGKTSLRCWRRCAMQELGTTDASAEEDEGCQDDGMGEVKETEVNGGGDSHDSSDLKNNLTGSNSNNQCSTFNADLLCEHGALHPNESCRRLVSEAVWSRFVSLFPACPTFQRDDPLCDACLTSLVKEAEVKEQHRQLYIRQKELLQDLFSGKNRPKLSLLLAQKVFVVSAAFVEMWKKYVRNREGAQLEPLKDINNKSLLCDHAKLLYPVQPSDDFISPYMVLVWEAEWEHLVHNYDVDITIEVFSVQEEGGEISVFTIPEVCDHCVAKRLREEEEDQFSFDQEIIFVRKVIDTALEVVQDDPSPAPDDKDSMLRDPDFNKTNGSDTEPSLKRAKIDDMGVRKSQRHRRQRGEKEVRVSSDLKLRDFKIKVMNLFSIPTFDQNLSVDGRPITDSDSTLGQLRLYPGCLVIVKADEPNPDTVSAMESVSARKPEEGFKGTNLVGS